MHIEQNEQLNGCLQTAMKHLLGKATSVMEAQVKLAALNADGVMKKMVDILGTELEAVKTKNNQGSVRMQEMFLKMRDLKHADAKVEALKDMGELMSEVDEILSQVNAHAKKKGSSSKSVAGSSAGDK